jgi:hypothetical protein
MPADCIHAVATSKQSKGLKIVVLMVNTWPPTSIYKHVIVSQCYACWCHNLLAQTCYILCELLCYIASCCVSISIL